ncbi:MAG TPA: alpha/beta hydrolase [Dehalococcoidia bacterium]|nr:alpha/beta hydrolase [Dehalococcoidia bacterium]
MDVRDGFVEVGGLRLHYVDYGGDGPPLVLEHGTGLIARIWDELAALLCSRYHVLALDRRGHGDSDKPEDGYGFDETGRELAEFCAALGFAQADAVGHSGGGTLLPFVNLSRSGLLRRGVMIDPIIFLRRGDMPLHEGPDRPPIAERIARRRSRWPSRAEMFASLRNRAPYDTWTDGSLRAFVEHGTAELADGTVELKCPPAIEARMYGAGSATPLDEALRITDSSLRIIRAELSDRVPQPAVDAACRLARDCRAVIMPGVTHFAPMEQPEAVARLCLELLAE